MKLLGLDGKRDFMISDKFTYGSEIEWSDADASITPPEHLGTWNDQEWTNVNSDGVPNDPSFTHTTKGGEFNLKFSNSIEEHVDLLRQLKEFYPDGIINYRTSGHIHIGVPGLLEDFDAIIRLFTYWEDNMDFFLKYIVPKPADVKREDYSKKIHYQRQRIWNMRHVPWFRSRLPQDRVERILKAKNLRELQICHFRFDEEKQAFDTEYDFRRANVNFLSLIKHGTIEYRAFTGTLNVHEFKDYLEFYDLATRAGLWDHSMTIEKIWNSREWKFPPSWPMIQWLEESFTKGVRERSKNKRRIMSSEFRDYQEHANFLREENRWHTI